MSHLCNFKVPDSHIKKVKKRDFHGGPVVKSQLCNTEDESLIPGQGAGTPRAIEQLGSCTTTTEPAHSGTHMPQLRPNAAKIIYFF